MVEPVVNQRISAQTKDFQIKICQQNKIHLKTILGHPDKQAD